MNSLSLRISDRLDKSVKFSNSNMLKAIFLNPSDHVESKNLSVFNAAESAEVQISLLKAAGARLKKVKECKNARDMEDGWFLVDAFIAAPMKHPVKNSSSRIIASLRHLKDPMQEYFNQQIVKLVRSTNSSPSYTIGVCSTVNSCFENFCLGVDGVASCIEEVLHFLWRSMSAIKELLSLHSAGMSPTEKMENYTHIHNITRSLISVLQKCEPTPKALKTSADLSQDPTSMLLYFLNHPDTPINTKGNCALILLIMVQFSEGRHQWIKLIPGPTSPERLVQNYHSYTNSDAARVCIFSAIINTIHPSELESTAIHGTNSSLFIVQELLNIISRSSTEPAIVLSIARAVLSVSRILNRMFNIDVIFQIVNLILQFVWGHMEHFMDSVRHLSQQILTNLVKVSKKLMNHGNTDLLDTIFESIKMIPLTRRSYYIALGCLSSEIGAMYVLSNIPNMVYLILESLHNDAVSSDVSSLLEILLTDQSRNCDHRSILETWIKPITAMMSSKSPEEDINGVSPDLDRVLQLAIKLNPDLIPLIWPGLHQNKALDINDDQLRCILICLRAAKISGSFDDNISDVAWKGIVEFSILEEAAIHSNADIRISTIYLLVESHKSTERFSDKEFDLILKFFLYNLNAQSPSFRQNLMASFKKVVKRWDNSFGVIQRQLSGDPKNVEEREAAEYYLSFLRNLRILCLDNIFIGANYGRRHCALQTLLWIQDVHSTWKLESQWTSEHIESLIGLLDDSYELNKILSLEILKGCSLKTLLLESSEKMHDFVNHALKLASSVKPTDCPCAAFRLQLLMYYPEAVNNCISNYFNILQYDDVVFNLSTILLQNLKTELQIAKDNLLMSAGSCPMYGVLYCIRHLLSLLNFEKISRDNHWTGFLEDIINTSIAVNETVAPVVNSSSPEGHLPMDFNAGTLHDGGKELVMIDGTVVTAQMVLLCAWRSVKEVSLLLGEIANRAVIAGENGDLKNAGSITEEQVLLIGDHLTTLLSETKHRGAFEQAYVGFTKLCSRLWKCSKISLHSLPRAWLDGLMEVIQHGNENSKLCATRRSAGVPFMVQALVTTELIVSGNPQCFKDCMATLLRLATFDGNSCSTSIETRTHCLNILRALFRNATLGEIVNPYVCEGLITAITGFDGGTWAERNSSTLLFSSLMTRVFGVQRSRDSDNLCVRNRMTGRIFFLRYPKLYDFMLDHLRNIRSGSGKDDLLRPSLYPVLLLLSRLYPSSLEGIESNLKLVAYIPFVSQCAESRVLKTRQLAAKAIVPLISPDRYMDHTSEVLLTLKENSVSHNYCHGMLLQLKYVLKSIPKDTTIDDEQMENLINGLANTIWILKNVFKKNACFLTADVYAGVLHMIIIRIQSVLTNGQQFWPEVEAIVTKSLDETVKLKTTIDCGKEAYLKKCVDLKLSLIGSDSLKISETIECYVSHDCYEVIVSILNHVLCLYYRSEHDRDRFEVTAGEAASAKRLSIDVIRDVQKQLTISDIYRMKLGDLTRGVFSESRHKALLLLAYVRNGFVHFSRKQSTKSLLETLINHSEDENDNISYVYIMHIGGLFNDSGYSTSLDEGMVRLCEHLLESCSPDCNVHKRQAVCSFLEKYALHFLSIDGAGMDSSNLTCALFIWTTILTLLDDDEEYIRKEASLLAVRLHFDLGPSPQLSRTKSVVELKAKELLLDTVLNTRRRCDIDDTILILLFWALFDFHKECREEEEFSSDTQSRVFDKGEMNTFQEDIILTKICLEHIHFLIDQQYSKQNHIEPSQYIRNILSKEGKLQQMLRLKCGSHYATFANYLKCDVDFVNGRSEFLSSSKAKLCTKSLGLL